MKRCPRCGETKPRESFNRNRTNKDGLQSCCRACSQIADRAYQQTPRAKVLHRRWHRRWRAANREHMNRYRRRWQIEHPDRVRLQHQKVAGSPQEKARRVVRNAIKAGRLVKPTSCENCHQAVVSRRLLHAHHADYSKPLAVSWLCAPCHGLQHRMEESHV